MATSLWDSLGNTNTNNNGFVDTSKYLNMDYNSSPVNFSGDTSSAGYNAPIPTSDSFMNSMKTKANPWDSSTGTGGGAGKGFNTLGMFGAASQGLSALGSLVQAYNGYKQIQLGRDAFNFSKATYNQDTANQSRLVNSELEDRQKARISSTGNNNSNGAYESLGSYMNKNRVSANPI